jgi:serine/threonine protein phosphatase PrpC
MSHPSRRQKALRLHFAGNTHIGGREHNEDTVLLRPDLDLYMVADGAGGHNAGNIASALATTTVAHYFEATQSEAAGQAPYDEMGLSYSGRRLATAFQRANREVIEVAESSETRKGMGTTLVAAYFDLVHGMLVLGHVGDSRCYRLRDGRLERLTQDHTLVNDVLEMKPDLDPSTAAKLPRNVITNALGMEQTLRVSVRTHEIAPGDRYLLCSDGLTDQVDDGEIQQALQLGGPPDEQARLLIDLAAENGRDNIAVVVLACSLAPGVAKLPEKPIPPKRRYPEKMGELDAGALDAETEQVEEHVIDMSAPHEMPQAPETSSVPPVLFAEHPAVALEDDEPAAHAVAYEDEAIPYSPLQTPPPPRPEAVESEPPLVEVSAPLSEPAPPALASAFAAPQPPAPVSPPAASPPDDSGDDDEPEIEIESKPASRRRPDETMIHKGKR